MRRFFADPEMFSTDSVTLSAEETRHLRDVLRLSTGDEVAIFDGRGREFRCVITNIAKTSSAAAIIDEVRPKSPESPLALTMAVALLKGDKFDLVIQKLVELGVHHVVPLLTHRIDVKLHDAQKRVDRWSRVAMEATKQCGRAALMTVEQPARLDEFLRNVKPEETILFVEAGGTSLSEFSPGQKITGLVGPEGGWEDDEVELARSNHVAAVTLGGRILRAETAAISIAAILQHRFGDLN